MRAVTAELAALYGLSIGIKKSQKGCEGLRQRRRRRRQQQQQRCVSR